MENQRRVRAKLRCLEISRRWNQTTEVRLAPVTAKNRWTRENDDHSEENARFWSASPTGEMKVMFDPGAEVPYEAGRCYYIDLERVTEAYDDDRQQPGRGDLFALDELGLTKSRVSVSFRSDWYSDAASKRPDGLYHAHISMGVDNEAAWPAFREHPCSLWRVVITPAG